MPPLHPTPNDEYNSLRGDVQRLLATLQENNRNAIEDRKSLQVKIDALPEMFNNLRREQQAALDSLKRDFERMFVPRSEYDPKYQIVQDRMAEYDRIIRESRSSQDEYSQLKQLVKTHSEDIEELQNRASGTSSRVVMWMSIAIAVASLAINLLSHLHFS